MGLRSASSAIIPVYHNDRIWTCIHVKNLPKYTKCIKASSGMSFPSISNSGQPLQVRVTNLQGSRITSKAWIFYPIWPTITASLDYYLTSSLACNSNLLNVVLKNCSTKKENWFHLAAAILSGGSLSTVFQIKMKWEIESWEKKNPKNNDGNQY